MATSIQKTNILAAEDWRQIYKTFKEADFQSYDFVSLRKAMIDYLRVHYPEDFNDFIESSEYVALIDLIAYLGQNLAYRTDVNARENFLDTAERRDSILKLSRLISYNPKRTICASGLMKVNSITTSESIVDSNGIQLANIPILWADATNDNWQEQFTSILNAALVDSQQVGRSGNSQVINGVKTDEYSVNITSTTIPVFSYSTMVNGNQREFEVVSATTVGKNFVYEEPPKPTQTFNILHRSDNNGNSSNNTGFFAYFKQGELLAANFSLPDALPNRVVSISTPNINNTDVWLYSVLSDGTINQQWTQVPAVNGMNIVYNKETDANLFQVVTKTNDQIDLVFGDGSFSAVPQGNLVLYYRTSVSDTYKITPEDMQNINIVMSYVSRIGRVETLTLSASLRYTVSNAVARESIESIRERAPQQYYTQNRMITGEDYNLFPYANYSNVLKVKALNRTSSGISRLLDIIDSTGKYSGTNIYADDGLFYKEVSTKSNRFTFSTSFQLYRLINDAITRILSLNEVAQFYYSEFTRYTATVATDWTLVSMLTNESTGYFRAVTGNAILPVGPDAATNLKYIRPGSIIKFAAPAGKYFNNHNDLAVGTPVYENDKTFLYACVMDLVGDGTADGQGVYADGTAPITLNIKIPSDAVITEIIPPFDTELSPTDVETLFSSYINATEDFGIAYSPVTQAWTAVTPSNLGIGDFDLNTYGDNTGLNADMSSLIWFVNTGAGEYTVYYRTTEYIFESEMQVKFYFDENISVFDSKIGKTVYDQIRILKTNSRANDTAALENDLVLYVHKNVTGTDGYDATNKIYVTYPDTNEDSIADNPDLFLSFVDAVTDPAQKTVYHQITDFSSESESFLSEVVVPTETVVTGKANLAAIEAEVLLYPVGQLFYTNDGKFYVIEQGSPNRVVTEDTSYNARIGRDKLSFQYKHNSPNYQRIDPSPANIIDIYLLTKTYDEEYRRWIQDATTTAAEPVAPTTYSLSVEFADLENYKPVSDSIIFNSVKFRPLFGAKADPTLQATFKVVKNKNVNVSDNDVKSKMILEINNYFSSVNRDLGETFYFSELSAYLHSVMSNMISSVIITPKAVDGYFGSLYQINATPGEMLISAATVDDIEIISAVTLAAITLR